MNYEININHQFTAGSEIEAKDLAKEYVSHHLNVRAVPQQLLNPIQVVEQCQPLRHKRKEHFCAFFLDTQNNIVGKEIVSIGTLNSSLIHPRECFRAAIRKSCNAIIVAHNHPSGSIEPSAEDRSVTNRLTQAGTLLGIEVLDHVIVTAHAHFSFREHGLI
ncbi:MAG TPA: DNA repair protein RadC [Candidatus Binataceae bacterium]|nr:DNA repair protein RadC [Candidatus Binataceae bacterium]